MDRIRIGTRGSQLALWQSNTVAARLREQYQNLDVELVKIKTTGDKILDSPLSKIGDKGLFVKEIEIALQKGQVDIAVHSAKDMPTEIPSELMLAVFVKRDDPSDALVSVDGKKLAALKDGAVIGTSSLRRRAQLMAYRPDFQFVDLRGNVDTRLRKLKEQNLDAIILSGAGLTRLGLADRITERILASIIIPAVGQGLIVIETRRDKQEVLDTISFLNDKTTEICVRAERAFSLRIGGGCQVPIGALARLEGDTVKMQAVVASLDGTRVLKAETEGLATEVEKVGVGLAERLLQSGANEILDNIRQTGW